MQNTEFKPTPEEMKPLQLEYSASQRDMDPQPDSDLSNYTPANKLKGKVWLYARDQNEFVNEHGQDLINFIISCFVYGIIFGILCFIGIGFILLVILFLIALICPIFGAIAASKSQNYRYPLTIKFF